MQSFHRLNYPWTLHKLAFATSDRELAKDLAQKVWMKFLVYYRSSEVTRPEAVLHLMVTDAIVDWGRRPPKERVKPVEVTADTSQRMMLTPDPGDMAAADCRRDLASALAALPPQQSTVMVLRYYLDMPRAEVAHILGVSEETVKSRLTAAKNALRDAPALAGYPATTGGK